jgi:vacuolar-type H+-ATPase subunit I/STV1
MQKIKHILTIVCGTLGFVALAIWHFFFMKKEDDVAVKAMGAAKEADENIDNKALEVDEEVEKLIKKEGAKLDEIKEKETEEIDRLQDDEELKKSIMDRNKTKRRKLFG